LGGVLCTVAVEHGQGGLASSMWLREQGCPADLDDCHDIASDCVHTEVVEWLGQFTDETWHTTTN
jgi:hypothetical protein